jgi:hypothetical protein
MSTIHSFIVLIVYPNGMADTAFVLKAGKADLH